mmetsp:Transcript_7255/g.14333  ORF Transcript_7255/g.14333 Transcript_7255/m.14333 type:complete len:446 (-) Transcript_7255:146-1483(-)
MGIKGLAKLLSDEAPECMKEVPLSSLQGRRIAIDASMAIYQFLIAVRSGGPGGAQAMLTNADGETTSHVQGMFTRTIRFLSEGIRPVYVFDGKPPNIKSGELAKRREKREKAEAELKKAKEEGNVEEEDKQSKRLVRAGTKENEDCKKLLRLMGVPVINAPCEAEAQAAHLAREGAVWAAGTEDMDCLTFRTPIQIRKMTFSSATKTNIQQIDYGKAIAGLELTHDQFVDLCILLGCDYCDSIRGVGPKTALKLIREHKCIEEILKHLNRDKYGVPDDWIPNEVNARREKAEEEKKSEDTDGEEEDGGGDEAQKGNLKKGDLSDGESEEELIPIYVKARDLFNNHEVLKDVELKWVECQAEELTKFLVDEMGFNADRVKGQVARLQKALNATAKPQMRMDSFFKPKAAPNAATLAAKRKAEKEKSFKSKKAKKGGGSGFFGKKKK